MEKFILVFLTSFLIANGMLAQDEETFADSIHVFQWSAANASWVLNGRDIYTMAGKLPKENTYYTLVGNSWVNDKKYQYTYDTSQNLVRRFRQDWDAVQDSWTDKYDYENTYNAKNQRTSSTRRDWTVNGWVNGVKYTYFYDAKGNLIERLKFRYNTTTGSFENDIKYDYTYDAGNLRLTNTVYDWNAATASYVPDSRYTYEYSNGVVMKRTYFVYNAGAWLEDARTLYSEGNIETDQDLVGVSWNNAVQRQSFVTANNALAVSWGKVQIQYGDDQNYLRWETLQESNVDHFEIEMIIGNEEPVNIGTVNPGNGRGGNAYVFPIPLDIKEALIRVVEVDENRERSFSSWTHYAPMQKLSLFPNPATDEINIFPNPGAGTFLLRDLTGAVITTQTSSGGRVDVRNLPSGTYFISLVQTENTQSIPFIIQR